MQNTPDHPDIASALRTGHPRDFHWTLSELYDEDREYDERREEALSNEADS